MSDQLRVERVEGLRVLSTKEAPAGARLVDDFTPTLIDVGAHHLCPGCGEPIAMRSVLEIIEELGVIQRAIGIFGIGCYTAFSNNLDCEVLQALHARGVTHVIECGPGKVLSRMVQRIVPDLQAGALFDPASLADTRGQLS